MLGFGVFLTILVLASAAQQRFDNYKVFRVMPKSNHQFDMLKNMSSYGTGYAFWDGPTFVNRPVDIMVPPRKLKEFTKLMKMTETEYVMHIDDVQNLIENENSSTHKAMRVGFGWRTYHTLDEIYTWLDSLAVKYPNVVEVVNGGETYEGRFIKGVKVSFKPGNPGVFLEGNIHAREWITSATVTYLLNEILESNDPDVREMAERHDWYVFPVVNPDGFVYTHEHNRLWRKTRKPYSKLCYGVDPNRNWGFKWNQGGASSFPCAETFAGSAAFSDVETKSLSKYIKSVSDNMYAYIAFHSYSQLLLFPYGHTTKHLDNYDELYSLGKKMVKSLANRYGTQYVTGNIAETIYVASGSSMDWVKGTFKTPITYTYELRDTGKYGFLLPASQIIPTGEETMDSLVTLFKETEKHSFTYGI